MDATRREERFAQGFSAAQSGIALKELSHPDNPITKIFGPTGYEQGAQFFAAQTAVSGWQLGHMQNLDELKTLDQSTLGKRISDTTQGALTGDTFADAIISKGVMDATGPLLNTIAKKREAWQQTTARIRTRP